MLFISLTLVASTALLRLTDSATIEADVWTTSQKDTTAVTHVNADHYGSSSTRQLRSQVPIPGMEDFAIALIASRVRPSLEEVSTDIRAFKKRKTTGSFPESVLGGNYPMWPRDKIAPEIKSAVFAAEKMIKSAELLKKAQRVELQTIGRGLALDLVDENAKVEWSVERLVAANMPRHDNSFTRFHNIVANSLLFFSLSDSEHSLASNYVSGMLQTYMNNQPQYHFLSSKQMLRLAKKPEVDSRFLLRLLRMEGDTGLTISLTLMKMLGNRDQQEFATKYFDLLQDSIASIRLTRT
uniref:Uncharacterized protein n=1 Tax=Peronospora matthiolae TaxID=2874970 RepID=A0AAV1VAL5_9STRA